VKAELKEKLIDEVRAYLETIKYDYRVDVEEIEKDFTAYWKAYSKLEKHQGVCVHTENEIHLNANYFLPVIADKPNSDIKIVDAGDCFYVKTKGINKTWFCMIKKNFFMFGA